MKFAHGNSTPTHTRGEFARRCRICPHELDFLYIICINFLFPRGIRQYYGRNEYFAHNIHFCTTVTLDTRVILRSHGNAV